MAVAVDNTGQSSGGVSTTTVTISAFAVGSGSNRCIYLGVSQFKTADVAPTAVFNGSESFVLHDTLTIVEAAGVRRVSILKLVNPSNVTANIVVSWASAVDEAVCGATSWFNVNQAAPFGPAVKNSSAAAASSTISVTGQVGDVCHDVFSMDAGATVLATGNQTQRWRAIAAANTTEGAGQSSAGTGAGISMTWTTNNGSIFLAHIGVAIQQAAPSGSPKTRPLPLTFFFHTETTLQGAPAAPTGSLTASELVPDQTDAAGPSQAAGHLSTSSGVATSLLNKPTTKDETGVAGAPPTVDIPAAAHRFGWFTDKQYSGVFSQGPWLFQWREDDNNATLVGHPVLNVFASTSRDFGNMRFLTQLNSTTDWWQAATNAIGTFTSSNLGPFKLNNEYLFFQLWCHETASFSGGQTLTFNQEGSDLANTARSLVVTPAFFPKDRRSFGVQQRMAA